MTILTNLSHRTPDDLERLWRVVNRRIQTFSISGKVPNKVYEEWINVRQAIRQMFMEVV